MSWLLVTPTASADAGPHPSMRFIFHYAVDRVAIESSQLIECADAACTHGNQPGQFECISERCWATWYGYGPFFKLVIKFTDRTRESNIFENRAFNDTLRVTVLDSSLQVESLAWPLGNFFKALLVTLLVETGIAGGWVFLFKKLPKTILAWVPLASLLSLPIVWFVFPKLTAPAGAVMCLYEIFAVVFETGFIYLGNRKLKVSLAQVVFLSFVMNFASFVAGFSMIG
ncbi:MAG: hypothetical protein U0401_05700 [Anaerolineae bacterium]